MKRLLPLALLLAACQPLGYETAPVLDARVCVDAKETYRATLVDLAQKALDDASHDCRESCEDEGGRLIDLGATALALATRLEDHRSFASLPRPPASASEAVVVAHERATVAHRRWRSCGSR